LGHFWSVYKHFFFPRKEFLKNDLKMKNGSS
jgi:hypothetical protein